jgi:hypothetical protein
MSEQAVLDVLGLQRRAQEGIIEEIDHADAQVIGRAPVRVDSRYLVVAELRLVE